MRKEFSTWLESAMIENSKVVFLTGDLGFMAFEGVARIAEQRFVNVGVGEQNMIGLAAGMASEGLIPICYSIAPFITFRPFEQTRLDVCLHRMNVKLIGNGGGYGYGIMGATHHALEDLACLSSLPHMRCIIPASNEDLPQCADELLNYNGPTYLRLGAGSWPNQYPMPKYSGIRKICSGTSAVAVALGPIVLNLLKAVDLIQQDNNKVELPTIYAASELPLRTLDSEFIHEVNKTKKVLVFEEHTQRGGLAEQLALLLMKEGVSAVMKSYSAQGYPNDLYGSQAYHQKLSGLDAISIAASLIEVAK